MLMERVVLLLREGESVVVEEERGYLCAETLAWKAQHYLESSR